MRANKVPVTITVRTKARIGDPMLQKRELPPRGSNLNNGCFPLGQFFIGRRVFSRHYCRSAH
jgi:hypothetical protein